MTSHELARQLLALPDLPVKHFDPSRAGYGEDIDTGLSVPTIEVEDLPMADDEGNPLPPRPHVLICGPDHDYTEEEKA